MSKAGQMFRCVVCKEPNPEVEASFDDQFGGPVCDDCRVLCIKAVAYLKHHDIDRPFSEHDVNEFNCNRIKYFYK